MSMPGFGSEWAGARIARLIEDGQSGATGRNGPRRPLGGLRRLVGRLRPSGSSPPRGVREGVRLHERARPRPLPEEPAVPRTDARAF